MARPLTLYGLSNIYTGRHDSETVDEQPGPGMIIRVVLSTRPSCILGRINLSLK